jgi:hypothetical protein
MDKNRKTSHILNIFQYDEVTGAVTLPSTLTIAAPSGSDNSTKVVTSAWARTYVTGLNYLTAGSTTTSDIGEGTNLYYTTSRFNTAFSAKSTSDLTEGTNLYYTTTRFNTAFSGKSTTDLSEGTNQYFTNARARAAISVTGSGSYDSTTGVITVIGGVTAVNTKTGDVTLTTADIAEGINKYYTDSRVGTYLTSNGYATQSYVTTQIANLVDSSPATLDTLNELAAALGDDPNFATTVATSIGTKQNQLNGTGFVKISGTTISYDNNTYLTSFTETDPIYVASTWYSTTNNATNWNTAYGWGNHASAGYAASSHTHSIANVTGLQTALDGKQASGSYAASVHTHIISDVTGLQTALDGKQASLGYTPYNSTNPSGYISSYTETDTLASVTGRGASTSTNVTFNGLLNFAAVGNVSFTSNDASSYPRFTGSYSSAQIGLFRSGSAVGGMYIGGTGTGFYVFDSSFNTRLFINQNGDTAFNSSTVTIGGNQVWHAGNLTNLNQLTNGPGYITSAGNAATATFATNSSKLYSTDAAYCYNCANPYYGYLTYDGTRWLFQVSPSSPAAVRVAYSDTTGSISGYNNPTASATANTIVYRDGSGHISGNYILGSYFNASAGNSENPSIGQIWTQSTSDDYLRKSTPAHFISQLGLITSSNISSQSVNYASSAGNATTVGGVGVSTLRGSIGYNSVSFYVNGDANTYYPVMIGLGGQFGMNRYSISRGYSDPAPWDPIGTGSHRGGLTLTFDCSSDIAWGGNDKSWRIIQFAESYTTMVAGMALPVTGGIIVWLRGGGAYYNLQGPNGINHGADVYYSGYTAANGAVYSARTSLSNVDSEIRSKWPVRNFGDGDIYVNNSRVLYASGDPYAYNMNQNVRTTDSPSFRNISSAEGYATIAYGYNNNGGFAMNNAGQYWGMMWNYSTNDWRLGWGNQVSQTGWNLRWDNGSNVWVNNHFNAGGYIQAYGDLYLGAGSSGQVRMSTYNTRNLQIIGTSGTDVGILGTINGTSSFGFQLYASSGEYGFLNGTWASWDLRKSLTNGNLYMNNNNSYYLNTTSYNLFSALNLSDGQPTSSIGRLRVSSRTNGATEINSDTYNIMLGPTSTRTDAGYYYAGIAINGLMNYSGGTGYDTAAHIWIGAYYRDTPGSERSDFIIAVKSGTGNTGTGADIPQVRVRVDYGGNLTATGDITAFSDIRVKENIVTIDNALDVVQRLRGVYYNRKDLETKKRKVGVIAQETELVLPEVVDKDATGMYNVAYGNMVGLLIEAIKEQQGQIEDLKRQINYLVENK